MKKLGAGESDESGTEARKAAAGEVVGLVKSSGIHGIRHSFCCATQAGAGCCWRKGRVNSAPSDGLRATPATVQIPINKLSWRKVLTPSCSQLMRTAASTIITNVGVRRDTTKQSRKRVRAFSVACLFERRTSVRNWVIRDSLRMLLAGQGGRKNLRSREPARGRGVEVSLPGDFVDFECRD